MNEKKIEPTDAMVDEAANALSIDDYGTGLDRRTDSVQCAYLKLARITLRAALSHPDAAGLFECDYTDYVHVDEAAARVEAAREQGWDDAAQHIYNKGWEGVTALRKANPHRPAPTLPTNPATVIVTNDGCEYIEAVVSGVVWRTREAILSSDGRWHGVWRAGSVAVGSTSADSITLDTCKVDDR